MEVPSVFARPASAGFLIAAVAGLAGCGGPPSCANPSSPRPTGACSLPNAGGILVRANRDQTLTLKTLSLRVGRIAVVREAGGVRALGRLVLISVTITNRTKQPQGFDLKMASLGPQVELVVPNRFNPDGPPKYKYYEGAAPPGACRRTRTIPAGGSQTCELVFGSNVKVGNQNDPIQLDFPAQAGRGLSQAELWVADFGDEVSEPPDGLIRLGS